jgi:hypothetical protein
MPSMLIWLVNVWIVNLCYILMRTLDIAGPLSGMPTNAVELVPLVKPRLSRVDGSMATRWYELMI